MQDETYTGTLVQGTSNYKIKQTEQRPATEWVRIPGAHETLLAGIDQSSINQALAREYSDHITDNECRLEQVLEFKARLYESLVGGMLTKEEYASYKAKCTKQAEDIRESVRILKEKLAEVLENRSERNWDKFSPSRLPADALGY